MCGVESRHAVRQSYEGAKCMNIEAHGWRHMPPSHEAGVTTGHTKSPPLFSPYGENGISSEKEDVMLLLKVLFVLFIAFLLLACMGSE